MAELMERSLKNVLFKPPYQECRGAFEEFKEKYLDKDWTKLDR